MSNENNSGILILLGAIGTALFMNTETGKKTDAHLSNAFKTLKDNLPQNKSNKNDIITK